MTVISKGRTVCTNDRGFPESIIVTNFKGWSGLAKTVLATYNTSPMKGSVSDTNVIIDDQKLVIPSPNTK